MRTPTHPPCGFQYSNHLEVVAKEPCLSQPRQNEERAGPSRSAGGGGLVASRLSVCFLAWESLAWVQRHGRCWERGCWYAGRAERKPFLQLLLGLSPLLHPRRAWSVLLANAASALSGAPHVLRLIAGTLKAMPPLFFAWHFLSCMLPILICWAEQVMGLGERERGQF